MPCLSKYRAVTALIIVLGLLFAPVMADDTVHSYDIPAGPLADTLSQIGRVSGVNIVADPGLIQGKSAPAVAGSYSPHQAVQRALSGSGLEAITTDSGAITIRAQSQSSDSTTLPVLQVTGAAAHGGEATASSPVGSFVAKRSATGTKSDIALIETPQSITVVSREQMDAQNVDNLSAVFNYSAGIYPLGGDGYNGLVGAAFVSRGFNITGSAPLYLNGSKFPINSLSGGEEPYFYERIELLKGPSSILYGQAAPGGVINMVSKRPTAEDLREIQLHVGSWNRKQVNADFGGAITDDGAWSYRVTGLVRESDAMIDEIPDDRKGLSTAISWLPNEQTSLTLLATLQENETIYDYGKPFDGTVLFNPNGKIDRDLFVGEPGVDKYDIARRTFGYLFEHEFDDTWKFRQNLLWYKTESDYATVGISNSTDSVTHRTVNRFLYTRLDEENGYSVDTQLQAFWDNGSVEHTVLLGVDYADTSFKRLQAFGAAMPLDVYDPVYGSPTTINPGAESTSDGTQLGVYLQDHIKIDKQWVILLGGRWDDAEEHYEDDTKTAADAFTYRTGFMYLFENGVAPYVSYSESFQPTFGTDFFNRPFEPTTGQQYEAGFKYEPRNYNATLTAAIYELTQQNVTTPDLLHPGNSIQEGEIQTHGIELEARASLNNNLELVAAFARTDGEVTKSNSATLGRKPFSMPDKMASLWLDYNFRSGNLNGFSLGGGGRYIGETHNIINTFKVPPFTVFDTALRYEMDQWRFALNVKNLFDRNYVSACTFACFYGQERNINFSTTYNW